MSARVAVVVLAVVAALIGTASAGGQVPREGGIGDDPRFDLWTGIWEEVDSIPARRLVLRQFPDGELHGIFWNTSAQPPAPETLDPEFLDLIGFADPGGDDVELAQVSIPGGFAPFTLEIDTRRYPWEIYLTPAGSTSYTRYRYVSGGDNRALLEFGRSWDAYRNGVRVADAVRRGDRVRVTFELDGLGPRAVAEEVVVLTVLVPRRVGTVSIGNVAIGREQDRPPDARCVRAKGTSFWKLTCSYRNVRHITREVHIDVGIPKAFTAKNLTFFYELALGKGWKQRSGLEQIRVRGTDPVGTVKIRVLPPKPIGGGGGGGGTAQTRKFTDPTGTVTVPGIGATGSGRILFPQAIITPQAAADEYCKRVDDGGHYTMTATSIYRKAIAFEAEAGGGEQAVGLLLWEIVPDPVEVFASITCST